MFRDQLAAAIARSSRASLPEVSRLLWRAYAEGHVTEEDAQHLSEAIEIRKALPPPLTRRRVGTRPRTPESLERRRRWAAAGRLPPQLAAHFTLAEAAVLAVVAFQCSRHQTCCLPLDAIAALAGVSRTTAKNALREAQALGAVRIEERRITGWRNDTNVVSICSPEWRSWLRLRALAGGGVRSATGTSHKIIYTATGSTSTLRLEANNQDSPRQTMNIPRGRPSAL